MKNIKDFLKQVQSICKKIYKLFIEPIYNYWFNIEATKAKESYLAELKNKTVNDIPLVRNQLNYALKQINNDCAISYIKDISDISRIEVKFFTKFNGRLISIEKIDKKMFMPPLFKDEFPIMKITLINEKLNLVDVNKFVVALNRIFYDNACSAHKRYEDISIESMKALKNQITIEEVEKIFAMQEQMIVDHGVPFRTDGTVAQLHILDIKEEINGEIHIFITFVDIPSARKFADEYAKSDKRRVYYNATF